MAAANTDKWRKKRSNYSSTLNGAIGSGDTTINLNSTSGLPTDTACTVTIDRVDSSGNSTSTKMERVVGVVSGNQLINCTRGVDNSPSAQAHTSGAVVEDIWEALSWNDAASSFLSEHNQSGTHNIPASSIVSQYAADTGTANAYAATLSPAIASYVTGTKVRIKIANTNTTVSTLNLNALGTKTIKKYNGATDLAAGDLQAGAIYIFVYDGTNFQLLNQILSATPATLTGNETLTNKILTSPVLNTPIITTPTIRSYDGWIDASQDPTWTYASATSFTIAGVDKTLVYTKGTRIKLTNGGSTKYFVVTSSSFSTNTTVNITGGSDYTLANSAITVPFFSYDVNPQGYPGWFAYTTTFTGFSANPSGVTTRFSITGKTCTVYGIDTGAGTSNATGKSWSIPVTVVNGTATVVQGMDNGALINIQHSVSGTTAAVFPTPTGSFTASGNCRLFPAGIALSYEF